MYQHLAFDKNVSSYLDRSQIGKICLEKSMWWLPKQRPSIIRLL